MKLDDLIDFEKYKKTKDMGSATASQRIFEWQVQTQIDFIKNGIISDAADCLEALFRVKPSEMEASKRKCDRILKELKKRGYVEQEKELRWRLQRYLKGVEE